MVRVSVFLGACVGTHAVSVQRSQAGEPRKITEVVQLLKDLMEASQKEGDTERTLFAKYKCYCDTNDSKKKAELAKLLEEISVLEAKIEELQAFNGELSKEVGQLDKDMTQNKADRDQAQALRDKEHEAFVAQEADLKQAIKQMRDALSTLSEVGADQSMNSAADHGQYMAGGASLIKLKQTVNSALLAAAAFVTQKQVEPINAFLQAPFTGTYSARSGEVVGILKSMEDTFKANLVAATDTEAREAKAHKAFEKGMIRAFLMMSSSYERKQNQLGANDADLGSKKGQLEAASEQRVETEDFLAKLTDMCEAKTNQYEERVNLRTQEEAALSQAISILNSDAAFATFGKVSATSSGSAPALIQLRRRTVRVHRQSAALSAEGPRRHRAQAFLQSVEAESKGSSPLLTRIVSMLQANNPFKTVISEISKMLKLIVKEEKADVEQKVWCDSEREDTTNGITKATDSIRELTATITDLHSQINDPATGLLVQISNTEEALSENSDNQDTATEERKQENEAYNKDIAALDEAQEMVARAIQVLTKYYESIATTMAAAPAPAFVQVSDDPAPPSTFDDTYSGQSAKGGHGAIEMLNFIAADAAKEEETAHKDEKAAQLSYEENIAALKVSAAALQETLVSLKSGLATAEKDKMMKEEDLEKTTAEKASLEHYLEQIKPGCDFITTNLESRQEKRAEETKSLKSTADLLKGSPVYKQAEGKAHQESLGECQDACKASEAHADCKACLAKVTVVGYCAGHPDTEGC